MSALPVEPAERGGGDDFVDLHPPRSAKEQARWNVSPAPAAGRLGGKARRLIELAAEGLLCPPGFVLPVGWFEQWLASSGTANSFDQAWNASELAATVVRQLHGAPLPGSLAPVLTRGLASCGLGRTTPLAVRSSAAEEDGGSSSFAGMFETRLGVTGLPQILHAVRAVWLSALSPHVIAYSRRRKGRSYAGGMAVVIQRLLSPSIAGTLFTLNPVCRIPTEVVVEYTTGLGEGVVSGSVIPARLRVERSTGKLIAAENVEGRPALAGTAALDSLMRAAFVAERVLGGPADVEWAVERGRLFVLQARPITSM